MRVETHGCDEEQASPSLHVFRPGDVYARDDFIYWGFTPENLRRLGALAGFASFDLIDTPVIDGNPRLIGVLNGGEDRAGRGRGPGSLVANGQMV